MRPRIADLFERMIGASFFVPDYAALYVLAVIAALFLAMKEAERAGLDPGRVFRALVVIVAGAFVSARLFVLIQYGEYFLEHPIEILRFREGGTASSGAYAGAFLAAFAAARRQRLALRRFLDCCAPPAALAVVLGRLGCFMNGCCYGAGSDLPWAVRFPEGSGPYYDHLAAGAIAPHGLSLPVHPTQLYEALSALILFGALTACRKRPHRDGEICALFVLLYFPGRFLIEFVRGDSDRGFAGIFSIPQIVALAAIIMALFALARLRKSDRETLARLDASPQE